MPRIRTYDTTLRDEQTQMTRERVLEGLIRVIVSDGVGELSVPAVAAEAGVSVPTVYRHFGSKQGLVDALGDYVITKTGLLVEDLEPAATVDDLVEFIGEMYRRASQMDPGLRAAMATDVGQRARRRFMPQRLQAIGALLGEVGAALPDTEFERLRNVVLILGSSAVMRAFKDYLDVGEEEAADTVKWAVRLIVEALTESRR